MNMRWDIISKILAAISKGEKHLEQPTHFIWPIQYYHFETVIMIIPLLPLFVPCRENMTWTISTAITATPMRNSNPQSPPSSEASQPVYDSWVIFVAWQRQWVQLVVEQHPVETNRRKNTLDLSGITKRKTLQNHHLGLNLESQHVKPQVNRSKKCISVCKSTDRTPASPTIKYTRSVLAVSRKPWRNATKFQAKTDVMDGYASLRSEDVQSSL